MHFDGDISGARAQMSNFNSMDINGISTTITGDLNGVFTGTGSTQAFVSGFSLEALTGATLQGVGLLDNRNFPGS